MVERGIEALRRWHGHVDQYLIGVWPYSLTPEILTLLKRAADRAGDLVQTGPGYTTWTIHKDGELIAALHCARTADGEAVEIVLAGGRGAAGWLEPAIAKIAAWATDEGCSVLRVHGRKGWWRYGRNTGWRIIEHGNVMSFERSL